MHHKYLQIAFAVSTFSCGVRVSAPVAVCDSSPIFPSPFFSLIPFSISLPFTIQPNSIPSSPMNIFYHSPSTTPLPVIWNTCSRVLSSGSFPEMGSPEISDWVFDYGVIEDIPVPGGDLPSLDLPVFTLPSCDFAASFRFFFFLSFWWIKLHLSLLNFLFGCVFGDCMSLKTWNESWMGWVVLLFWPGNSINYLLSFLFFPHLKKYYLGFLLNYMLEHGTMLLFHWVIFDLAVFHLRHSSHEYLNQPSFY